MPDVTDAPPTRQLHPRPLVSWVSLIRTARVSYCLLALIAVALLWPPQMRDMLVALREDADILAYLAFPLSLALFGVLCWYWARAAVSARFDLPDTKLAWENAIRAGDAGHRPRISRSPLHIVPQAPIPLTGAVGFWLAYRSEAYWLGLWTLLLLLVLWGVVDHRRTIRDWFRKQRGRPSVEETLPGESDRLQTTESVFVWFHRAGARLSILMRRAPFGAVVAIALLSISVIAFVATALCSLLPADTLDDGRNWIWTAFRGPTPVLLGCALLLGPLTAAAFVCDGWRPTLRVRGAPIGLSRFPLMTVLIVATMANPAALRLHTVRVMPASPSGQRVADRVGLDEQWRRWQAACGKNTTPIIVAISGGASRAGLWGASVLDKVDSLTIGHDAAIFAVSSVSGGSLGAAAYLAVRAAEPPGGASGAAACQMGAQARSGFAHFAKELGKADEIGPLLAGYVFSDLPRALIGWLPRSWGAELRGGDRAAAIERAFEANARDAATRAHLAAVGFDAGFLTLRRDTLPLWIANGTERDTGARALTIAVCSASDPAKSESTCATSPWPFRGASDVLGQLAADVPISTAINNTARFPFLEPAGLVRPIGSRGPGISILDGGYYDNSGLETALELAAWINERTVGTVKPIIVAATGDGDGRGASSPDVSGAKSADKTADPPDLSAGDIVRCGAAAFQPERPRPPRDLAEVLSPIIGLYKVRAGHVDALLRHAVDQYCTDRQRLFHFYLAANGRDNVPLNWVLSARMADHAWRSADHDGDVANDFIRMNVCEARKLLRTIGGEAPAAALDCDPAPRDRIVGQR